MSVNLVPAADDVLDLWFAWRATGAKSFEIVSFLIVLHEVDASWKSYSHPATCTLQNVCFPRAKSFICWRILTLLHGFYRWAWAGPKPRQSLSNVSHGKAWTSAACTSCFNIIVVGSGNTHNVIIDKSWAKLWKKTSKRHDACPFIQIHTYLLQ